ncbi:MAG: DJ/PfpI family protein [Bacillota bacterium]|nr:DJ/PfpI family protein [Bacillota bacterium]
MVYVHLADGFEEIEALAVVDILRRAEIPVKSVSIADSLVVRGAHDIYINADLIFEEADYDLCEMIILPGGMPGTKNLAAHEGLASNLKHFAAKGKWLAAICAAPSVLGGLSLLEGKRATSFPGFEEQLFGANYTEERVVRDGNFLTSRGPGTAIEFGLAIVALLKNEETAQKLRKAMIV